MNFTNRDDMLVNLLHGDLLEYGAADVTSYCSPETLRNYVDTTDYLFWADTEKRWVSTPIRNPIIERAERVARHLDSATETDVGISVEALHKALTKIAQQHNQQGPIMPLDILQNILLIGGDWVALPEHNTLLSARATYR